MNRTSRKPTNPAGAAPLELSVRTMTDDQEQAYIQGSRMAWLSMLQICLTKLGIDDPEAGKARWILEREMTVQKLRDVCRDHGDNDWPEDLHLADVIEKHLYRHLGE